MTDKRLIYTITSTDPEQYNVIRTNLQTPFGEHCNLSVPILTTKATFVLLNTNDYITIGDNKYYFDNEYGEISADGFAALLNEMLIDEEITVSVDSVGRLVFTAAASGPSDHAEHEFTISDMTYNAKMISGFYNDTFPINSENGIINARSVGFSLSTPILYLISNLGAKCYDNVDENYCDRKVLMRVSNTFSSGYPIVSTNGEFSSIIPVNSLSNIEFRLVDGNMKDIKLLTPLYLSVMVESITDEGEE